jgi:hypothetical protein
MSGSRAAPTVVERRRVELVADPLPRQPYHAVAEAGWPATVIDDVARAATAAIGDALRSIARTAALGLIATERKIPAGLDRILASHTLLHSAEGQLFEHAVIEAGNDMGVPVHVFDPKAITVPAHVDLLGRQLGPPWQKDHKWAATAALTALHQK